jgi:aspartate carbamoyltransferase catalytic subunit
MNGKTRSLLAIEPLKAAQINELLSLARKMDPKRPRNTLRGRRIALLFYENSTRTRTSFEIAAKSLGATTTVIHATSSSIEKGESLKDTGLTLRSIVDAIVVRHPNSGAPNLLARILDIPIINAGDGANLVFCGPEVLLPAVATELAPGIQIERDMDKAISGADVIMMLRVQQERLSGMQINLDEYIRRYQLTVSRVKLAKKDAIIMHPGPMIRGMELTDEVADHPQSVVLEQVLNGVKVRMAILSSLLGGRR